MHLQVTQARASPLPKSWYLLAKSWPGAQIARCGGKEDCVEVGERERGWAGSDIPRGYAE
jgi:hypothetical protein